MLKLQSNVCVNESDSLSHVISWIQRLSYFPFFFFMLIISSIYQRQTQSMMVNPDVECRYIYKYIYKREREKKEKENIAMIFQPLFWYKRAYTLFHPLVSGKSNPLVFRSLLKPQVYIGLTCKPLPIYFRPFTVACPLTNYVLI